MRAILERILNAAVRDPDPVRRRLREQFRDALTRKMQVADRQQACATIECDDALCGMLGLDKERVTHARLFFAAEFDRAKEEVERLTKAITVRSEELERTKETT